MPRAREQLNDQTNTENHSVPAVNSSLVNLSVHFMPTHTQKIRAGSQRIVFCLCFTLCVDWDDRVVRVVVVSSLGYIFVFMVQSVWIGGEFGAVAEKPRASTTRARLHKTSAPNNQGFVGSLVRARVCSTASGPVEPDTSAQTRARESSPVPCMPRFRRTRRT